MTEEPGLPRWQAVAGWVLFDWAAQPFYTLILTFLFAPYFVSGFLADPVYGQALWGYAVAGAAVIVALTSPLLGAIADAAGQRKPWIAVFSVVLVMGLAALWFAAPGETARLPVILLAFCAAYIAAEYATVFTNAMMADLVPPARLGRLSGIGWATGYAGGLAALLIMACFMIPDPATGKTLIGRDPLIALDAAARQGDRLAGPFSALWYLVFVLPFFLFTPDRTARAPVPLRRAARQGLAALKATLTSLGAYKTILLFLAARMLYVDGLGAIFTFGGIYAVALFGWPAFAVGLFGIILTVTAALGAIIGGVLDDRFGAPAVILWALAALLVALIGILSIDETHVLFLVPVAEKTPASGLFTAPGERLYVAFAMVVGLAAGPLQAASRSLMARLAPEEKRTELFGLFAFSGKVTAFLAPFLIATLTALTGSQRIGIAAVILFLVSGFALMLFVRSGMTAGHEQSRRGL